MRVAKQLPRSNRRLGANQRAAVDRLRALETRSELATIAAALVGGAWSVMSLLAIPAIALEDAGPVEAIKRSGSLFKQHWGGRVTGMAAIGFGVLRS